MKDSESDTLARAVKTVTKCASRLRQPVDWHDRSEAALWRELVACILGSRVAKEEAGRALARICASDVLDRCRTGHNYDVVEDESGL